MSEYRNRDKEESWTDDVYEDEHVSDAYEETYWDGSVKNECWSEERE